MSKNHTFTRNQITGIITAILLLAALLRLVAPDTYIMWVDEYGTAGIAVNIVQDGDRPLRGPIATFEGLDWHSPFSAYVVALFTSFVPDPAMTRVSVGLLGVLAVAVWFSTVRLYFGVRVALVAAMSLSVFPLAVHWTRFVWNPNVGHVFAALWFYTGLRGAHDGDRRMMVLHWLMLSANIQSQSALLWLFPFTGLLTLWYCWRQRRQWLPALLTIALGVLIFGLSLLPWGIGLRDFRLAQAQMTGEVSATADLTGLMERVNLVNTSQLPRVFSTLTGAFNFPSDYDNWAVDTSGLQPLLWLNVFGIVPLVLTLAGLSYWPTRAIRNAHENFPQGFLAIMSIAPLSAAIFLERNQSITNFYFVPLMFAATAMSAYMLVWLWDHGGRVLRHALTALMVAVWLSQVVLVVGYIRFVETAAPLHPNGNFNTLSALAEQWLEEAPHILLLEETQAAQSLPDAVRYQRSERYPTWRIMSLRYPVTIMEPEFSLPVQPQGSVIVGLPHSQLIPNWFPDATVTVRNTADEVTYLYTVIDPVDVELALTAQAQQFGEVARLLDMRAVGCTTEDITVQLIWQSLIPAHDGFLQFSLRLADGEQERAQRDFSSLEGRYWGEDVLVYTRAVLPAVPDSTEIRAILYDLFGGSIPVINNPTPYAFAPLQCP